MSKRDGIIVFPYLNKMKSNEAEIFTDDISRFPLHILRVS
jgi:hypothetical protein